MNGDFYDQCLERGEEALLVEAIRCGEIGIDEFDEARGEMGETPLIEACRHGHAVHYSGIVDAVTRWD